jgi:hypothetical protein
VSRDVKTVGQSVCTCNSAVQYGENSFVVLLYCAVLYLPLKEFNSFQTLRCYFLQVYSPCLPLRLIGSLSLCSFLAFQLSLSSFFISSLLYPTYLLFSSSLSYFHFISSSPQPSPSFLLFSLHLSLSFLVFSQ